MTENKLIRETIGVKISRLIDKNNLQKTDIARKIGVSRSTFDSWAKGVNAMSVENIAQVASAFNMPVGYFFDETEENTTKSIKKKPKVFIALEIDENQEEKVLKMVMGKEFLKMMSL